MNEQSPRDQAPARPEIHINGRPDELLRDFEAAAVFGVHRATLRKWVAEGKAPKPIRINGCARWRRSEIEAFLSDCTAAQDAA